jgi:Cu+-exporting ATPase
MPAQARPGNLAFSPSDFLSTLEGELNSAKFLAKNFFIACILSLILLLGRNVNLSLYTQLLLCFLLIVLGGRHFVRGFKKEIRARKGALNTLVSLSVWSAFFLGAYAVFAPETIPEAYRNFYAPFIVETILLITLGQYLEIHFKNFYRENLQSLKRKIPRFARLSKDGNEFFTPRLEVRPQDEIIVKKGEEIPVDGLAQNGGIVDEFLLNDRKALSPKTKNSKVCAGSFVQSPSLSISANGGDSLFALMISSIVKNSSNKFEKESAIDLIASWTAALSIVSAAGISIFWALEAPSHRMFLALSSLASLWILACPPALTLAKPLAIFFGLGKMSKDGIRLLNANIISRASKIDTLLFDKTGVLTEGNLEVVSSSLLGESREEFLSAALAALQNSPHLSAQAAAHYARNLGAKPLPAPESLESIPGKGIILKGKAGEIRAGNLSWLKESGCQLPTLPPFPPEEIISFIGIARDLRLLGYFTIKDSLRPRAKETVEKIKEMGITPILVSGDRNQSTHHLAEKVGLHHVFSEVSPEEKTAIISRLKSEGKKVAVLASSFYDAEALSLADIGLCWESGNAISKSAADITVANTDLSQILKALQWTRSLEKVIRQNILLSFLPSLFLIPIGCGFFYQRHGLLLSNPQAVAAGLFGLAAIIINSIRRKIDA